MRKRIRIKTDEMRRKQREWARIDRLLRPDVYREREKLKYQNRKERVKEYSTKRVNRRRYWLNKYKCAKGCKDCGYNKSPVALDWDHLNERNKMFCINGGGLSRNLISLFYEIRKCEIVCANCHRIRTHITRKNETEYKRATGWRLLVQEFEN